MERKDNLASGRTGLSKMNLSTYRELIERFLSFVLIKCACYTNSKRLAETIAVYIFASVYYTLERLDSPNQIPQAINTMADVVGKDLAAGADKPVNGELLFEANALRSARALNELEMEEALVIILYYVEKLSLAQIASITGGTTGRIIEILDRGQKLFIESLARFQPPRTRFLVDEVRLRIDYIVGSFDRDHFEKVIASVMNYLIRRN